MLAQINDRSSAIAWSALAGHADVLAIGAKEGGGGGFDDTGGELELYDMNLTTRVDPTFLASVKTQSRFASLGWSSSSKYPMGMVAGGMENGAVHIWDPHAVIEQQGSQLIASYDDHGPGTVKALEFNKLVPSQLATGGSDGKVLIFNLDQPDAPPFPPCANTQQRAPITSLAWNTQVPHILASAAADGTVTVWDINNRKAWCELRAENSGQPISAIAWNPKEGLQLLTASADDRNPVIKVWDLRTSTSMPLATLTGHSQGILSMAWCPHDEHMLLTCGKDNRTILWDLYTSRPIGDVPNDPVEQQPQASGNEQSMFGLATTQQRRYDVQWSPIKRGIISTASLDRKVQVHSILGLSSSSGRPPKWMRPSSSVSCGFGGSIVYCGSTDTGVRIRTVVQDPQLAKVSRAFESTMDPNNVITFCQSRASIAQTASEKRLWQFMSVIFQSDARHMLLDTLGFDPAIISAKASAYTEDTTSVVTNGVASVSLDDKNQKVTMSPVTQDVVKQALMVGSFEAAVECCLNTGNLADALVLASCGGEELWTRTKDRYFQSQSSQRPFLSVVSSIIRQDFGSFVQASDPAKWQETLAVLSTYSSSTEFPQLCVALGDLLEEAGDHASASLCYMCSLNLDKAVKYWRSQFLAQNNGKNGSDVDMLTLHEFVVKTSVYLLAVGSSAQLSPEDAKLFTIYAEKLAEQGFLVSAAKYCKGNTWKAQVLRDRLYRSRASHRCLAAMGGAPPDFPFVMQDIKKGRAPAQPTSQSSYGQKGVATSNGYQYQQQQQYSQQQSYSTTQPAPAAPTPSDSLPPGWIELQDPGSGLTYYANQSTGEVTWDRPQAALVQAPVAPESVQETQPTSTASNTRNTQLASKYGDGFVSSHSRPELGGQYGNVGTSNPYHNSARPSTAQGSSVIDSRAPVSGNLDTIPELNPEYQPISDTLLSLIDALKGGQLSASDRRQLSEAEKGVAIFVKRLARGDISDSIADKMLAMTTALSSYDWTGAGSIQTALVSQEWRTHKEWLKGVKALVLLATKLYSQ
ncbi:WD40 repeat-containing protein [Nitzschia inconspicua]|uniref:WD40 repeat-containing protein n=1 Tax=Nitzschia inconspicua TaxID=303405 RepID=A0A9K3PWN6_9STRA|nr:WD40 repeat-containing protein [Nitzschia inconspicua]